MALHARELQQDVGTLISGWDSGYDVISYIQKVLINEVEQCARIADRGYIHCESVQRLLNGVKYTWILVFYTGFCSDVGDSILNRIFQISKAL